MLKPVEKPIKFVKNLSTKGKSFPITHVSAVIDDNGESVKSTIDSLKNKASVTKVTWLELKNKRDAGKLIPGSLYRITDYQCTTTQKNTQSAGHQFDIVLLALSENKLAEEGWAMMHIDNIYKVVFDDNEVVSCYVTPIEDQANRYYLVNVDTLLGTDVTITSDRIDEDNKIITLIGGWTPDALADPDLPYNYFQNSNLSAWKVWYCLDNDKSRFAWAATPSSAATYSLTINSFGSEVACTAARDESRDSGEFKCFVLNMMGSETSGWIKSETISVGTVTVYMQPSEYPSTTQLIITSVTELPPIKATGVIYRLIDEWGNDVPWDYKNILFTINDETTYSLSMADQDSSDEFDATLNGGTLGVIVNTTHGESRDGRTPKSIYPISRVTLQQCLIYLNKDVSPDSYLFTNNSHANIIYGLEIYDPKA